MSTRSTATADMMELLVVGQSYLFVKRERSKANDALMG